MRQIFLNIGFLSPVYTYTIIQTSWIDAIVKLARLTGLNHNASINLLNITEMFYMYVCLFLYRRDLVAQHYAQDFEQ